MVELNLPENPRCTSEDTKMLDCSILQCLLAYVGRLEEPEVAQLRFSEEHLAAAHCC